MTSIIRLTPFSGVLDETPLCYMLQVDEFRFLLDCGWDEHFSLQHMENVNKHIGQIDAVLLSYPDNTHLGLLPYLVGKSGLSCPIYATIPVYKMGQMFMYDLYQSRHNTEDFDLFTLDDVDAAFDKVTQVKYSQSMTLKGKGHGLVITALPAGHMVGGTIWKIVKDGEEEIVYAVDYNHKKERHLNGCVLETISRPSLLITDAYNAMYQQTKRRQRDEQLMNIILNTMRSDGNVLIAVDTAGRVVELSLLLDQLWHKQESGLGTYSLAMLNNVSYNVVEFAKSMMEWMSDKVMRSFEDQRNNPFQFKHLLLCHSLQELAKVPEPKVVLASVPDMECGYSRDLFLQWSTKPNNSIILTSRTSPTTISREFIQNTNKQKLWLKIKKRVPLERDELEAYRKKEKEREDIEKATKNKLEVESSSDESDDESQTDMKGLNKSSHDLMIKSDGGKKSTSFFKHARKSFPMFPFHEERIKWDEYGEIIKPEDYALIDATGVENEDKDDDGKMEVDENIEEVEMPTKCVATEKLIDIRCSITFIDFEGRSDGESMKKLITQVKPRQLILVHGSREATTHLADYCRAQLPGSKVFTPEVDEVVDATMESHIYQVRLTDAMVSSLEFAKTPDAELAWIDGQLDAKAIMNADVVPTLESLSALDIVDHEQVFLNAPRFQALKQVLARNGINVEMSGGVLVCNNLVAIKRNDVGGITVEGCVSEEYFKVKELLYEQYAII
ncbi:cleavage and polyadenylation specificity factor subunit 2-like [Antedon mediterranea]|uniref:cleavage and polyadenylation specificity factor subunit 2-like n=1 Tax=Antedon mediterranea TaxID=105859 RepID=UPI003AF642DF